MQTTKQQIEVCQNLLGEHPEDVISPIESAANALHWLRAILTAIKAESGGNRSLYQITKLAEAGRYIAGDVGEYAETQHEAMLSRLRAAGAACSQGEQA